MVRMLDAEVCGLRGGNAIVLEIGDAVWLRFAKPPLSFGMLNDCGYIAWFARLCDDGCDTSTGG